MEIADKQLLAKFHEKISIPLEIAGDFRISRWQLLPCWIPKLVARDLFFIEAVV
jgi:hypothetical protein